MRTNTYEMFKMLHNLEYQELKQAVKDFGGYVHFGYGDDCDDEKYDGKGLTHTDYPMVAVNVAKWEVGPEDVYIRSCLIDKDGRLIIYAEQKDAFDGEFELDYHDIEFGHISFITDQIPSKEDMGEPSNIQVANFVTLGGELVDIDCNNMTWQYGTNSNSDTTLSGTFTTDTDRPYTIIGFDGCDSLPYAVRDVLKRLGYALDLHS